MTDTRLISTGNIRAYWYLPSAFANWQRPTVAELNAGLNITDAISWNDFSFGMSASSANEDPSLAATSKTSDRGAAQYGGSLSFYYPTTYTNGSTNATTFAAISVPRTYGYIVLSIDGQLPVGSGAAVYSGGATQAFASGDLLNVYGVETDSYTDVVVGEAAYRYTIKFLPTGNLALFAISGTGADTVVVTPATTSKTVAGGPFVLTATVNGRSYERGLTWSTSDATKATVSGNGVVTPIAAGTVTITGFYPASAVSATSVVTLT